MNTKFWQNIIHFTEGNSNEHKTEKTFQKPCWYY